MRTLVHLRMGVTSDSRLITLGTKDLDTGTLPALSARLEETHSLRSPERCLHRPSQCLPTPSSSQSHQQPSLTHSSSICPNQDRTCHCIPTSTKDEDLSGTLDEPPQGLSRQTEDTFFRSKSMPTRPRPGLSHFYSTLIILRKGTIS